MKKVLSLVLAITVLLSTVITSVVVLANNVDTNVKTTVIDLTQDVSKVFATTGSTTATTATVVGNKLKVKISAYERQLAAQTNYATQTWFPNYLLAIDGSFIKLTNGSKAIVEVKYKDTSDIRFWHPVRSCRRPCR